MAAGTGQYSTVQYSTVQYSTVQYSTVEYNRVLDDTFFSRNSPVKGASAMSCGMGVSLPPSILNLKTRGMPLGMPTFFISSSDKLSMYFTTPEIDVDRKGVITDQLWSDGRERIKTIVVQGDIEVER